MAVFTAQKAPECEVSSQLGQYWSQSMHKDLLPPKNRFYLDLNPCPILLNSGTTINGCRSHQQQQWLLLKEKCWGIHWKYCYHAVQKDQWIACLMGGGKTKSNWASRYINIKNSENVIFSLVANEKVSPEVPPAVVLVERCSQSLDSLQPESKSTKGHYIYLGVLLYCCYSYPQNHALFQVYILFSPSRTAFKTSQ